MINLVLYSTGCPRCIVLKKKLQQKRLEYKEVNDINIMEEKGIMSVPVLEVNGECMEFKDAVNWVNNN